MSDNNSSDLEVRSYFVRGRNALLVRAQFEPLYIDYYLHLAEFQIRYDGDADQKLKDLLAAFTLYLASRPHDEGAGWTINMHQPLMNLFVTGATRPGNITGRVFTEDVKDQGKNLFIAQTTKEGRSVSQSMVDIPSEDVFQAVETFYQQSEQRLARLFRYDEEDIVMICAQPDCDEEWLSSLTLEDVRALDQQETLSLLETRHYHWGCGCTAERLFPLLSRLSQEDLEELFDEEQKMVITCPRCSARYLKTRQDLENWRTSQGV